jgi:hypothetical protein
MSGSLASPRETVWQMLASLVSPARFQKDHFAEYSNLPKMANFRRVLEFAKFAREWPLLNSNAHSKHTTVEITIKRIFE